MGSLGPSFFLVDLSFTKMSTILFPGIPEWAQIYCAFYFLSNLVNLVDDSHY